MVRARAQIRGLVHNIFSPAGRAAADLTGL